ncbi:ribonuclease P protein component [Liquorilactobacillus vini]|uniref:Ribonuclease P protein component n=1 Tax=Liquorilactobacillus vini DSM 20605 TaxID=1133569 RepID=A0A0R2CEK4_9LACO|nr:ribonuclease P protein component [Liquorilactobacillus vini]KRM86588.1 ribonuclease P [Liquorilactobacillus vini DSM 20605]
MRKSYRVKSERDFQRVFENGKSFANRQFVVYVLEKSSQPHFRVGISVGKKIGNAVARNWVKRRIRQSLTELKPQLKQNCDFIVIARPTIAGQSMTVVKQHLVHVLRLAQLLPHRSA